jgi:hypothetical protein
MGITRAHLLPVGVQLLQLGKNDFATKCFLIILVAAMAIIIALFPNQKPLVNEEATDGDNPLCSGQKPLIVMVSLIILILKTSPVGTPPALVNLVPSNLSLTDQETMVASRICQR